MDRPAKVLSIASALSALSIGAPASAGEIGATSSATVTISLTVAPHLDVRQISVDMGPAAGGTRTYGFCVSANTPTRRYGVALGAPQDDSAADQASPVLEWAGAPDVSKGSPIGTREPVARFLAGARNCSGEGSANATLIVRSPSGSSAAQSFPPATLLIVPE